MRNLRWNWSTWIRTLVFFLALAAAPRVPAQNAIPIEMAQIPAGSFTMGADAATLPDAVVNGFGVMSNRPAHGDFDELPALLGRIATFEN